VNRARLAPALTLLAALVFTGRASWRLGTYEFAILEFAVLGLPPWSAWALSLGELAGSLLLLWGRSFGAGVLALLAPQGILVAAHLAAGYRPVVPVLLAVGLLALARVRRGVPGPLG
jgi:hypothetical protein